MTSSELVLIHCPELLNTQPILDLLAYLDKDHALSILGHREYKLDIDDWEYGFSKVCGLAHLCKVPSVHHDVLATSTTEQ